MEVALEIFKGAIAALETQVANSGASASSRYQLFSDYDPFVSIPPALLSAGHLATYALTTGMIEPFETSQLAKPATYLVKVEGECRYRDEDGKLIAFYLSKDPAARQNHLQVCGRVRLAPNSVCFLTLAPEFRMPAYIAARFILLIRDVYRGLLVGTGPLVDPGFTGRLSLPIHNFTNKEYFIEAGEDLVYFEFTKLSWANPSPTRLLPAWLPKPINDQPPFPSSKTTRRNLDDYLKLATGSGPPQSSIGHTVNQMKKDVERASTLLNLFSIGGVLAAAGLVFTGWSVYEGAQQFTEAAQTELRESRDKLSTEVATLRAKQEELEKLLHDTQAAIASRASNRLMPGPNSIPTVPGTDINPPPANPSGAKGNSP